MKYFNHLSKRSRPGIPSMRKPASREINSASVELCETEVCFLHIQLMGTNVPKCTEFQLMLTLSIQSLLQNQSLEIIQICIVVLCFLHDNGACIHMCDECRKSTVQTFITCFGPFRDRTSKFVKYRVYQYELSIDISDQSVSKLLTILQLIQFIL